ERVLVLVRGLFARALHRGMPRVATELSVGRVAEQHRTGFGTGDHENHVRRREDLRGVARNPGGRRAPPFCGERAHERKAARAVGLCHGEAFDIEWTPMTW